MYAEMMRKQQQKDIQTKKVEDKKAIAEAADGESRKSVQETPEELERIRRRQAGL
jgi:hypothetical protein